MYQFVQCVSYIPEDILLLYPSPTMTHIIIVLIFLFPIVIIIIPFYRTCYISGTHFHPLQLKHRVVQYLRDLLNSVFKVNVLY